jgi:hypothetical protein
MRRRTGALAIIAFVGIATACGEPTPVVGQASITLTAERAANAPLPFGGDSWHAQIDGPSGTFTWEVDGRTLDVPAGGYRLVAWTVHHSDVIACEVAPPGQEPTCHQPTSGPLAPCTLDVTLADGDELVIEYRFLGDDRCVLAPG